MSRFDCVKYDEKAREDQEYFKAIFQELDRAVSKELKPGRASSLILTKLEEAYMWVGKAIRDEQIVRSGSEELNKKRKSR